MSPQRTALVTGASSGIGRAVASALTRRGHRVIGTTRDPSALDPAAVLDGVEYLELDLTDADSTARCAAEAGSVDILVNNAGESQVAALEEIPEEALRRLFELNVFGQVRLTQLLIGGMRERGYGRVVMIGSMAASFAIPFRSSYSASKAAIRAFADSSRFELSPHGVWLTTVEPGAIHTGISERRTKYRDERSPFGADYDNVLTALDASEANGISPERVAATVMRAIEASRPKPLYAVGSNAPLAFAMKRVAPPTVVERVVARRHGLTR